MGSAPSKPAVTQLASVLDEKRTIDYSQHPLSDKQNVQVDSSLTHDNISKWTKDLEEVGAAELRSMCTD